MPVQIQFQIPRILWIFEEYCTMNWSPILTKGPQPSISDTVIGGDGFTTEMDTSFCLRLRELSPPKLGHTFFAISVQGDPSP